MFVWFPRLSIIEQCSLSGLLAYHPAIGYASSLSKWVVGTGQVVGVAKSTTSIVGNILEFHSLSLL